MKYILNKAGKLYMPGIACINGKKVLFADSNKQYVTLAVNDSSETGFDIEDIGDIEDPEIPSTSSPLTRWYMGDTLIKEEDVVGELTQGMNPSEDFDRVEIGTHVTSIDNLTFIYRENLTNVTIPNSVTSIGDRVFSWCTGLTNIDIPNSVTSIGDHAFYHCYGLTSIDIPNSVTSIGDSAFSVCTSLTSINIPNSVTSISERVLFGCSGLTSVTIPNSVTSIGYYAFNKHEETQDNLLKVYITKDEQIDLVIVSELTFGTEIYLNGELVYTEESNTSGS